MRALFLFLAVWLLAGFVIIGAGTNTIPPVLTPGHSYFYGGTDGSFTPATNGYFE